MMREWRAFRGLTAADRPLAPGALGDLPLAVITRADGGPVRRPAVAGMA